MSDLPSPPPPYPPDTRAKGWRFELDYEQIEQSSTWALAGPEGQAWALKLWLTAWRQVPCGSVPGDEEVIAAAIGMLPKQWARHRKALMRGWWKADDGRLYHETLTKRVFEMMKKRRSDSDRQAARREREAAESAVTSAGVTTESRVTPTGVRPESSTDNRPLNTEEKKEEKKTARKRAAPAELVSVDAMVAEGVNRQNATDWLVARKAKALPLTPTAWSNTKAEAEKAGLSVAAAIKVASGNGWAGFKASWLTEERNGKLHVNGSDGYQGRVL